MNSMIVRNNKDRTCRRTSSTTSSNVFHALFGYVIATTLIFLMKAALFAVGATAAAAATTDEATAISATAITTATAASLYQGSKSKSKMNDAFYLRSSSNNIKDDDDKNNYDSSSIIKIEDFSSGPINTWTTMNDPVMGGRSYSSLKIENGVASFEGKCAIVPSLNAPGFITMVTGKSTPLNPFRPNAKFPDVSTCTGLKFNVRSRTKYDGYYVSFGRAHVPGGRFAFGYKSALMIASESESESDSTTSDDFNDVIIPFNEFSSNWDDATGKTKVTCKDDPTYCPTIAALKNMKTMSFWGEGVEGDVALDIRSIDAVECTIDNADTTSTH